MHAYRRAAALLAVLALVLAGGCATTPEGTGEPISVEFAVDNNRPGIGGISAFLLTDAGARVMLGPVESNRTGTFPRTIRPGNYRLVAGRVGGDDIVSERFRIEPNTATVAWNVNLNQIAFINR